MLKDDKLFVWMKFFNSVLDFSFGPEFEVPTKEWEIIKTLDKSTVWKLKGFVATMILEIFKR